MFALDLPVQTPAEPMYVTSLTELACFGVLMALTMSLHGVGMIFTLRITTAFIGHFKRWKPFLVGLSSIIVASWLIVLVHLAEVCIWASFFLWKDCMPNASTSYYFSLLEYTTLGSDLHLPLRWRMLEGGIAIAGLLTFAWSTGVLLILAKDLQDNQMQKFEQRRNLGRERQAAAAGEKAAPRA